jgi:hypothetical protein
MHDTIPGLSVTLSAALYDHLCSESRRLGVALEWLVASLIVDTIDEDVPSAAPASA